MKKLSNAELQDAINSTNWLCRNNTGEERRASQEHFYNLLDEQRRRATESATLELQPMEPAPDRVEFDARVRAQDGPEWVEIDGSGEIEINLERRDLLECRYRNGDILKDQGVATIDILPWSRSEEKDQIVAYRVHRGGV